MKNIDLFKIREPTNKEWGEPGRHVRFFMHIISIALGGVKIENAYTLSTSPPSSNFVELVLGGSDSKVPSSTPIETESGRDTTLEGMIERLAREAATKVYNPRRASFDGGDDGQILARVTVNLAPTSDIKVFVNGGVIFIRRMSFDIGLRIDQSLFEHDRAENYAFVLAVEDCVKSGVVAASRLQGESHTTLSPFKQEEASSIDKGDVLQNDSLFQVWLNPLCSFEDFISITPGQPVLIRR